MSLEEFHRNFRSDRQTTIAERVEAGEGPFPSEELVFAEKVMEHVADTGICDEPTICHWNGKVGNAKLRITGYALSADETALDLFVTHYFGTEELQELADSDATTTASEGVRFLFRAASGNLDAKIDPTHPVRDLVATIRSRWSEIDRLRVFVITDGKTKTKRFSNKEVHDKMVRASFPRYRYDQIMRLGWKVFIPITIVWLLLVAAALLEPFSSLPVLSWWFAK